MEIVGVVKNSRLLLPLSRVRSKGFNNARFVSFHCLFDSGWNPAIKTNLQDSREPSLTTKHHQTIVCNKINQSFNEYSMLNCLKIDPQKLFPKQAQKFPPNCEVNTNFKQLFQQLSSEKVFQVSDPWALEI